MEAPEKHWLLVKTHWHPIERLLAKACPDSAVAQEQIDQLEGRVDATVIKQLHKLRVARNSVIHDNKPLPDEQAFERMAVSATAALNAVLGRHSAQPSSIEQRLMFNVPLWIIVFIIVGVGRVANVPTEQADVTWRMAFLVFRPLVWAVNAAIDVLPFALLTVPLTILALGIGTSMAPRPLERALRIYILAPVPLAFIGMIVLGILKTLFS
jgi:hypothetical protein